MGVATPHALGRSQRVYVTRETTFGTLVKATAASAVRVLSCNIKGKHNYAVREDTRPTRSRLQRFVNGVREISWDLSCYATGTGTSGQQQQELHELLKHFMGTHTDGGSNDLYGRSDTQGAHASLSITRELNASVVQTAVGAIADTMKISQSGGEPVKFDFSGMAKDWYHTGYSTQNGAASGGATVTVQTADVNQFEIGSVIAVGTDTNSGAGWEVTGKSSAVLTCAGATFAEASGSAVYGYTPTETGVSGTVISGTTGSLSIAGTNTYTTASNTLLITAFELECKNQHKLHTDTSFATTAPDYHEGFFEVNGSITVRARRDLVRLLGDYRNAPDEADKVLTLTCGNATGKRFVVALPDVLFDDVQLDVPQSDEALIKIPFIAMGTESSGAAANEITIDWT